MIKASFIGFGVGIAASFIGRTLSDSYPSSTFDIAFTVGVLGACLGLSLIAEARQ